MREHQKHVTVPRDGRNIPSLMRKKQNETLSRTNSIITNLQVFHLVLNFDQIWYSNSSQYFQMETTLAMMQSSDKTSTGSSNLCSHWSTESQFNSPWILFSTRFSYFHYLMCFVSLKKVCKSFLELMKMEELCGKAETSLIIACLT